MVGDLVILDAHAFDEPPPHALHSRVSGEK